MANSGLLHSAGSRSSRSHTSEEKATRVGSVPVGVGLTCEKRASLTCRGQQVKTAATTGTEQHDPVCIMHGAGKQGERHSLSGSCLLEADVTRTWRNSLVSSWSAGSSFTNVFSMFNS